MGGHTVRPKSSPAQNGRRKKSAERSKASKNADSDEPRKPKADAESHKKTSAANGSPKDTKQKPNVQFRDKKDQQRASTLLGEVSVLRKNERPSKKLWWLAGGRTRGPQGVPTAGELQDRKKAEHANRAAVGFLGTVFGVRAVKRVSKKSEKNEHKKEDQKQPEKLEPKGEEKQPGGSEVRGTEKRSVKRPSHREVRKKGDVKKGK